MGPPRRCLPQGVWAQPGCFPAIKCGPTSEQKGSRCWSRSPEPGLGPESIQGGQKSCGPSGTTLPLPGPPSPGHPKPRPRWGRRSSDVPAPPGGTLIPLMMGPASRPAPSRPGPPRLAGTSCCPQSLSQTVGTSDPASGPRAEAVTKLCRPGLQTQCPLPALSPELSPDWAGLRDLGAPREAASRLVPRLGLSRPRPPPPASAPPPHGLPGGLLLGGLGPPCPRVPSLPWITPTKTPQPGRLPPRTRMEEMHTAFGETVCPQHLKIADIIQAPGATVR